MLHTGRFVPVPPDGVAQMKFPPVDMPWRNSPGPHEPFGTGPDAQLNPGKLAGLSFAHVIVPSSIFSLLIVLLAILTFVIASF